jgi:hypothetical protein
LGCGSEGKILPGLSGISEVIVQEVCKVREAGRVKSTRVAGKEEAEKAMYSCRVRSACEFEAKFGRLPLAVEVQTDCMCTGAIWGLWMWM